MELLISLSSSLRLVPFTEELVEAFVEFRHQAHLESKYVNDIRLDSAKLLQKDWSITPKHGMLLLNGEEVVGQLFWTQHKTITLNLISVLQKVRAEGAAKLLINTIKSLSKKLNLPVELIVAADNLHAQHFYERNGFISNGAYNKKNLKYTFSE
jgi:ribosomal protein S18 acetylase RimI-like enzyme